MPPTPMRTTPKTMWCTWTEPARKLRGHHRTFARMSRTDRRMQTKLTTNAMKKQNSGRRPVWTICAWNQPDTITPAYQACRLPASPTQRRTTYPSLPRLSRRSRSTPVLCRQDHLDHEPLAHTELARDLGRTQALLVIKEREPLLRRRPRLPRRRRGPLGSRPRPGRTTGGAAAIRPWCRRAKRAAPLIAVFPAREFLAGPVIQNKEFFGRLVLADGHHGEAFCVYLLTLRCHAVFVFLGSLGMQFNPARNALSHRPSLADICRCNTQNT